MRYCVWLNRGCFGLVFSLGLMGNISPAQEKNTELIRMVLELLNDKDKDMRAVGLEQVRAEAKGPEATKQFASQLPKLMPVGQVGLLSALASRGDASAKPEVLTLLKTSKDDSVRVAAIAAIGELGDMAELPLLVQMLGSETIELQNAAKKSLSRLRGSTVNATIVSEMKNASSARVALIEVLVMRRASDSMPQITAMAVDQDPKVRQAAMIALAELGDLTQIPGMIQGVLKAGKGAERDAAEKALATVCGRNTKPELRAEPILAASAKLDEASQLDLLSTVARVGGAKALAAVETAMNSENRTQHDAGLQAFCKWPDASIADKLATLIEKATNASERSLEFKAFVRIVSLRNDKRSDQERLTRLKQAMSFATSPEEKALVLNRCRLAYSVDSMRYVLPYLDQPLFAEVACETIVELAHHREVREPNKSEFDGVLDRVMQISQDAVVKDRAQRYKNGQTWVRPKAGE